MQDNIILSDVNSFQVAWVAAEDAGQTAFSLEELGVFFKASVFSCFTGIKSVGAKQSKEPTSQKRSTLLLRSFLWLSDPDLSKDESDESLDSKELYCPEIWPRWERLGYNLKINPVCTKCFI